MPFRLDQRVQRNVLKIFPSVDQVQLLLVGDDTGILGVIVERVDVQCNVLIMVAHVLQDLGEDGFQKAGEAGRVDVEQELVEQGGRRSKDIAGIIVSAHTTLVVRHDSSVELGAQKLQRRKSVDCRVERAEFPRVELIQG